MTAGPKAVRQIAVAGGKDLDATLAFWNEALGLATHARFDPPGIAFVMVGGVRFLFEASNPAATIYLDLPDVFTFCKELVARGVPLTAPPRLVHLDKDGQFGPPGVPTVAETRIATSGEKKKVDMATMWA